MLYDYIIIGGGIVGLSTAWQLQQRNPGVSILILEKESKFAQHQTGHNSGVIHAGVYYAPNSLKARFCREGVTQTVNFCKEHRIPFQQCGKLLVATNELETQRMSALFERCEKNQIEAELLNQTQLKLKEPNVSGLGAIFVNSTGIVDYQRVASAMATTFREAGGEYRLNTEVVKLTEQADTLTVSTNRGQYQCRFLVACAGLMADRVAQMLAINIDFRIIPFRGEYYRLPSKYNEIVNHLIYPIPDPELPFLGVHLTRMIDGTVTVGPNAVLGWKREGYGQINVNLQDSLDMLLFKGFWANMKQNLKPGLREYKNSLFKNGYLKQVQKYCPQIKREDLHPYPTGIRAQAVLEDGSMVHDFLFAETARSLHVCNAPSPAATSAIPIGNYICDKIELKQKQR